MGALLTSELRRSWATSLGLMAAGLASSVAISNERGVFVPIHSVEEAIAAAASAFAAITGPPGQIRLSPYSFLTPGGPAGSGPSIRFPNFAANAPTVPFTTAPNPAAGPNGNGAGPNNGNGGNASNNSSSNFPTQDTTVANNDFSAPNYVPPVPGTNPAGTPNPTGPVGSVPEPQSWAMLIIGFGAIGLMQRLASRRRRHLAGTQPV